MSIKFHLPDGSETDMVINSLKFFLVANGEDFRDLFLAIAASPPGSPQPTKFDAVRRRASFGAGGRRHRRHARQFRR